MLRSITFEIIFCSQIILFIPSSTHSITNTIIFSFFLDQILSMETERFAVPEVLFNPSDVGINQVTLFSLVCYWQLLVLQLS
jgi:hypothetical protein